MKFINKGNYILIERKTANKLNNFSLSVRIFVLLLLFLITLNQIKAQSLDSIKTERLTFKSVGVILAGTIYKPKYSKAALVVVHGSGQEPRMRVFG